MNNIVINKEDFSRLFVLCVQNKMNLKSFSISLANFGDFTLTEEESNVSSIKDLFNQITDSYLQEDNSYGVYNDAYWCGTVYFYLYQKEHKPLSYLLWKLPLNKLIDQYPVYHEMDYVQIEEYFHNIESKKSILQLLCENYNVQLTKLAQATNININSLRSYSYSDQALYKAGFQNIYLIAKYFTINEEIFVEKI